VPCCYQTGRTGWFCPIHGRNAGDPAARLGRGLAGRRRMAPDLRAAGAVAGLLGFPQGWAKRCPFGHAKFSISIDLLALTVSRGQARMAPLSERLSRPADDTASGHRSNALQRRSRDCVRRIAFYREPCCTAAAGDGLFSSPTPGTLPLAGGPWPTPDQR